RMSVAGCTMVRIRRQSIRRDRATSAIRVASSARRGFTGRSTYNANCFFRKRFSAASWAWDLTVAETKRATSEQRRTRVSATLRKRDQLIVAASYPINDGHSLCVRALLGTGAIRPDPAEIAPDGFFADHRWF